MQHRALHWTYMDGTARPIGHKDGSTLRPPSIRLDPLEGFYALNEGHESLLRCESRAELESQLANYVVSQCPALARGLLFLTVYLHIHSSCNSGTFNQGFHRLILDPLSIIYRNSSAIVPSHLSLGTLAGKIMVRIQAQTE
ncbi:hypothetical protein Landi51_08790 [Colletotrichum acutatum]